MATLELRDGTYSLAYAKRGERRPWGAGADRASVAPGLMDTEDALARSRADFNASIKDDVFTTRNKPTASGKMALRVKGFRAVVRDDIDEALAIVGMRYTPVQFRDVAKLIDGTGFKWDSMGVLDGGRGFYGQALLGEDKIRDGDAVETFLMVRSSHDMSSPVLAGWSHTNIVCQNTLARATVEAKNACEGTVRHTAGANGAMLNLAKALQTATAARRERVEAYRALAAREVTRELVAATLASAYPAGKGTDAGDGVVASARTINIRDRVAEIFETRDASTGVRGATAWDLFQAVTAYESHERTVRGAEDTTDAQNTRWLRSTLDGSEATDRAFQFLTLVRN